MGGYEIMMTSLSLGILLAGGVILITLCFIEYLLLQDDKECNHDFQTTLESYHKKVCIDCGAEFPTKETEK
jgi:hypothetical protein